MSTKFENHWFIDAQPLWSIFLFCILTLDNIVPRAYFPTAWLRIGVLIWNYDEWQFGSTILPVHSIHLGGCAVCSSDHGNSAGGHKEETSRWCPPPSLVEQPAYLACHWWHLDTKWKWSSFRWAFNCFHWLLAACCLNRSEVFVS